MNELSWLLYFAGIAGPFALALNKVAIIGLVILGIVAATSGLTYLFNCDRSYLDNPEDIEAKNRNKATALKVFKSLPKWLAVPVLCFLLSGLIPPKNTLYLIAASEVGEEVVTSPTMQKAIDALNRILDNVAKTPAK